VESALRNANLRAIVVMTSRILDLSADNSTCRLYLKYGEESLFFRFVDKETVFKGTSVQNAYEMGLFEQSATPLAHYSDAIRLILVEKYGGGDSDLDMIVLKDLSTHSNLMASDQVVKKSQTDNRYGDSVCNAIFALDKGHNLTRTAIQLFDSTYDPKSWPSGGPILLTKALNVCCGYGPSGSAALSPKSHNPSLCQGVSVVLPRTFYPYSWFDATVLYQKKTDEEWAEDFKDSLTVHFFGTSLGQSGKINQPKYYGKARPALLYLAVRHCPLTLASNKQL